MSSPLRKQLPNLITVARLVLALVFFVILYDYRLGEPAANEQLNVAVALFILAIATDALDGYLARKWKVISVFGRVMDPLCDKILIIGALVFMAGPQFSYVVPMSASGAGALGSTTTAEAAKLRLATGVYSWMVVLVIFRELLVTGLRALAEQQGIDFSANWFGKSKLILQSTVIPIVLVLVANVDMQAQGSASWPMVRDILVYALVIVTVLSGMPYVLKAARHLRSSPPAGADAAK